MRGAGSGSTGRLGFWPVQGKTAAKPKPGPRTSRRGLGLREVDQRREGLREGLTLLSQTIWRFVSNHLALDLAGPGGSPPRGAGSGSTGRITDLIARYRLSAVLSLRGKMHGQRSSVSRYRTPRAAIDFTTSCFFSGLISHPRLSGLFRNSPLYVPWETSFGPPLVNRAGRMCCGFLRGVSRQCPASVPQERKRAYRFQ